MKTWWSALSLVALSLVVILLASSGKSSFNEQFLPLLLLFGAMAGSMAKLARNWRPETWIFAGLGLRVIWLLTGEEPMLSEDWMRYCWDGWLVATGENPYAVTPRIWLENKPTSTPLNQLLGGMNSPDYRAIYPPLAQYLFAALHLPEHLRNLTPDPAAWLFRWRLLLLAAEGVTLLGLSRLSPRWVAAYALHPLPIVEVVGNGHLDGVVLMWLVLALQTQSSRTSAIHLAAAIATKVFPVVLLPAWWRERERELGRERERELGRERERELGRGRKREQELGREVLTGVLTIFVLALPIAMSTGGFSGAWESAGLFAHTFEFNASLYFLAREIGESLVGYNPIAVVGPALLGLGLLGSAVIGFLGPRGWGFSLRALGAFTVLLACATTVHPWYLLYILLFGILSEQKWAVVASFSVLFSYGFYDEEVAAIPWGWAVYGLPFAVGMWEIMQRKS
jgi:hypothetical protein